MIIGLNEDIVYKGIVFHIQTEDRGLQRAILVSTLFYKGMILLEERYDYSKILNEPDLSQKLQQLKSELHERLKNNLLSGLYDDRIKHYFKNLKEQKSKPREAAEKDVSGLEKLLDEVIFPSILNDLGISLDEKNITSIREQLKRLPNGSEKERFLSLCALIYERISDRCSKEDFKRVAKKWLGKTEPSPGPLQYRDRFKTILEDIVYKDLEQAIGSSLTRALLDKVIDEIHPMFFRKPEAFEIIITRILNSGIIQKKTAPQWRASIEPRWKQKYQSITVSGKGHV